jgi:hypothetical protein
MAQYCPLPTAQQQPRQAPVPPTALVLSAALQHCSSSPGGRTSKARALAYLARPFNIPQGGGSAGVRIHRRHRLSTMKFGLHRDIHALLVVASQQQPGTRRALSVCLPTCLSSVCLSSLCHTSAIAISEESQLLRMHRVMGPG